MRNAAAHLDDDFDLVEPPRKKAARRGASGRGSKKSKRFGFSIDMQKVARYAAVGMTATVAIGIVVNALMMQKGRHPAPLFGKSIPLGQPAEPAPPKKIEASQGRTTQGDRSQVEASSAESGATKRPVEPPAPAPPVKPEPRRGEPAPARIDAIGRLLQGGGPPARETAAAKADTKPDTKTVLAAQRALVKLGFVLKPNGNLGPQTRKAIEMFEKDRHLPVKGELSRRVAKVLAAESGVKIEH